MEPTNSQKCPNCNVDLVDATCPQCGMKIENNATPVAPEATSPETGEQA